MFRNTHKRNVSSVPSITVDDIDAHLDVQTVEHSSTFIGGRDNDNTVQGLAMSELTPLSSPTRPTLSKLIIQEGSSASSPASSSSSPNVPRSRASTIGAAEVLAGIPEDQSNTGISTRPNFPESFALRSLPGAHGRTESASSPTLLQVPSSPQNHVVRRDTFPKSPSPTYTSQPDYLEHGRSSSFSRSDLTSLTFNDEGSSRSPSLNASNSDFFSPMTQKDGSSTKGSLRASLPASFDRTKREQPDHKEFWTSRFLNKIRRRDTNVQNSLAGDSEVPSETSLDEARNEKPSKGKDKGKAKAEKAVTITHSKEKGPFAFSPHDLAQLYDPKNLDLLTSYGGVQGLLRGLGADPQNGLRADETIVRFTSDDLQGVTGREIQEKQATSSDDHCRPGGDDVGPNVDTEEAQHVTVDIPAPEPGSEGEDAPEGVFATLKRRGTSGSTKSLAQPFASRIKTFGRNRIPDRKSKSLFRLMWIAVQDKVLIMLLVFAMISLAIGLYEDFGPGERTTIDGQPAPNDPDWIEGVAITCAVIVVVLVGSLNDYQKERQFRRLNAQKEDRDVKGIRSGQMCLINVHDVVVGDILQLEPGEIVPVDGIFLGGHNVRCDESAATGESDGIRKASYQDCLDERTALGKTKLDPFMISGSKVTEGVGTYVVTSVGCDSFNGKLLMSLRSDTEATPLQVKLNKLAETIAKIGGAASILLFVALLIRFFVDLRVLEQTPQQRGNQFIQILIVSVTLAVVAIPEGLPLATTLALAFATKKMSKENNLVRTLASCETMSHVGVICSDKTGTLTENRMTVVAACLGSKGYYAKDVTDKAFGDANSIDQIAEDLSPAVTKLLNDSITINSTAFRNSGVFIGSKTEVALIEMAEGSGWEDHVQVRKAAKQVCVIPFSSLRKSMACVIQLGPHHYRLLVKGASEVLLGLSTKVIKDLSDADALSDEDIDFHRVKLQRTILNYADRSLRTLALCYRDFETWPPAKDAAQSSDDAEYESLARDLTLIGIFGIEDPLRGGVKEAVATCAKAGVKVIMCTGDNSVTARSIATQAGIYTEGGLIMEGVVFRQLNAYEMLAALPRLQVLARSSPEDKKRLVEGLKAIGEVVAVTGDGTNDAPALKAAHVGFSMGISGTETAREASDVILLDDNFASIITSLAWGRQVNDSVKKFLQFQVTVNIVAVVTTYVTAVQSDNKQGLLTPVQLLWVNLIMDVLAALALATDPPQPEVLLRKPDTKDSPLVTATMWKQILGQALYQIVVLFILQYAGGAIFGTAINQTRTTSFMTFVSCTIFNEINNRRIDNRLNIFQGMLRNAWFMAILVVMIAAQILIMFVGGAAFSITRIDGAQWAAAIVLGFLSLPLGALLRCIPDRYIAHPLTKLRILRPASELPTCNTNINGYPAGIMAVRQQLELHQGLRGGRTRASSYVSKDRPALADLFSTRGRARAHHREGSVFAAAAMVPAVISGGIASPWRRMSDSSSQISGEHPSPSVAELALHGVSVK